MDLPELFSICRALQVDPVAVVRQMVRRVGN